MELNAFIRCCGLCLCNHELNEQILLNSMRTNCGCLVMFGPSSEEDTQLIYLKTTTERSLCQLSFVLEQLDNLRKNDFKILFFH